MTNKVKTVLCGTAIAAASPEGDNFLLLSMQRDFAEIWKN